MPSKPPKHQPRKAIPGDGRPSAAARGYDAQWRRFRLSYLRRHPLCVECLEQQRAVEAVHVDHVIALEKGGAKYDESNLQGLCPHHHSVKTCREDGGFGRDPKAPKKRG